MTASTESIWLLTLEHIRLRNGSVEITGETPAGDDALAPTYRARLLDFNDDGMIIEQPAVEGADQHLVPGAHVRVLILERQQRWELHTRIDSFVEHELRAGQVVPAMTLTAPVRVQSAQRRQFFRISTVGLEIDSVELRPIVVPQADTGPPVDMVGDCTVADADPLADAYEPAPFAATLMNIGGGGIGVQVPAGVDWLVDHVTEFDCHIELPDVAEPLVQRAHVTHVAPHDDGTLYLGLRFDFADHIGRRHYTDQVFRFTTWVQRRRLRGQRQGS